MTSADGGRPVRLGLRANLAQFLLLVGVNALVGGMIGQERTVLPLLAEQVFHLQAFTAALTFILAFGAVKALTNLFAGTLSDRIDRKPVLVAGWLVGLPVPLLLLWAPAWGWIIAANVVLCQLRPAGQPHRHPGRPVPGRLGDRAAGHRRPVGPGRTQVAHRRWHVDPGAGDRADRGQP